MSDSELEVNFDFAWRTNASNATPKTPKIAKIKMSLSSFAVQKPVGFPNDCVPTKWRVNSENILYNYIRVFECTNYMCVLCRRGPLMHSSPTKKNNKTGEGTNKAFSVIAITDQHFHP